MKKLIAVFALLASVCAFGAIDDTIIVIETQGPDKYADGTTVLDGERYAIVWSADEFAGFKADGSLVNDKDAVLGIVSRAKDGKCPIFAFAVASQYIRQGGTISVWLLDTRVFDAEEKVSFAKATSTTKVEAITAAAKVEATIDVQKGGAMVAEAQTGLQAESGAVTMPTDVPAPKITGFTMDDNFVYVQVEGTQPFLRYGIAAGSTPDALVPGAEKTSPSGDAAKSITVITPKKGDTGFFQVNRK